jgi:hypothetical protein
MILKLKKKLNSFEKYNINNNSIDSINLSEQIQLIMWYLYVRP